MKHFAITALVPAIDVSIDERLRYLLDQARPQIAACLASGPRAAPVDLELVLAVEPDGPATIVSTTAAVADSSARQCVEDAVSAIDTAPLPWPERAESWTVHASLYTGAP
jgi:hypothetical protein